MSRLDQLNKASFRGVDFLMPSESTTGGHKVVQHQYANSDKQFVESMGRRPKDFSVTAIIHGEDYINKRIQFENALDAVGLGELIHPQYGPVMVQVGEWTADTRDESVGQIEYRIPFYTSDFIKPVGTVKSAQAVSNAADTSIDNLKAAGAAKFVKPTSPNASDKTTGLITNGINAIIKAMDSVFDQVSEIASSATSTIRGALDDVYRLTQNTTELFDNFANMFNDIRQISEDGETMFAFWSNLVGYDTENGTYTPGSTSTVERQNIESNRIAIGESIRVAALVGLFETLAKMDFATVDSINNSTATADEYFDLIFENSSLYDSLAADPDLKDSVYYLRVISKDVVNTKLATAWKVSEEKTHTTSLSLLSYQKYGNIDYIDTLAGLNNDQNLSKIKDTALVLQK